MNDVAKRLEETLREEMQADRQLAQISRRLLKEAQQQQKMAARQEAETRGVEILIRDRNLPHGGSPPALAARRAL